MSCTRLFQLTTRSTRSFAFSFYSIFAFFRHNKTSPCRSVILHGEAFDCFLFMGRHTLPYLLLSVKLQKFVGRHIQCLGDPQQGGQGDGLVHARRFNLANIGGGHPQLVGQLFLGVALQLAVVGNLQADPFLFLFKFMFHGVHLMSSLYERMGYFFIP